MEESGPGFWNKAPGFANIFATISQQTLRHLPDMKDGICIPGDPDEEVTFNLEIE